MDDYEDFDDKQNTYPSEKSLAKLHKQVGSKCVLGDWTFIALGQQWSRNGPLQYTLIYVPWVCVCVFVCKGDLCGSETQQDSCSVADAPAAGHPPGRRG